MLQTLHDLTNTCIRYCSFYFKALINRIHQFVVIFGTTIKVRYRRFFGTVLVKPYPAILGYFQDKNIGTFKRFLWSGIGKPYPKILGYCRDKNIDTVTVQSFLLYGIVKNYPVFGG